MKKKKLPTLPESTLFYKLKIYNLLGLIKFLNSDAFTALEKEDYAMFVGKTLPAYINDIQLALGQLESYETK